MEVEPDQPMTQEDTESSSDPLNESTYFNPTPSLYFIFSDVSWLFPSRHSLYKSLQTLEIKVSDALDNIITSIPKLIMDAISPPYLDLFPNKQESDRSPYNLKPCDKKVNLLEVSGCLGNFGDPHAGPKERGRKSNLSKAQMRAKLDIPDGR